MAKKRTSGKPRGTDAGGQPIDLGSKQPDSRYTNEVMRAQNNVYKNFMRPNFTNASEGKSAMRNLREIQNAPRISTPIELRGANPMSGRTVEAGTPSIRDAMIRFMRGGGGSILRGK